MTAHEAKATAFSSNQKLGTLEVGRGLAALAVVAHHASLSSDAFTSSDHSSLFDFGIHRVDYFFVLSGFIIYHIHQSDPTGYAAAKRFLGKRIRRIYTPYLPISFALIALYLLFPGLSQGDRTWGWLTSITLLPSDSPPALSVAWTLTFEMVFYFFFLLFFMTRYFWYLVLGWLALVLIANSLDINNSISNPLIRIILDPIILEFLAGMVAAHLYRKMPPLRWWIPLLLGVLGILVVASIDDPHRVLIGLALAPVVLGLTLLEQRYSFKISKSWAMLGASSYAVYLIHNPLQSIVARVFQDFDIWSLSFLACIFFSLSAGLLYHLFYERPVLRALTRKQETTRPQPNNDFRGSPN